VQPEPIPDEPEPGRLSALVDRHQGAIWRYLRALGARRDEAEDLTQETFLAATRHGPGVDAAHERVWLRGIARNQWLRSRQWWSRRRERTLADFTEQLWVERERDEGTGEETVRALRRCLERLRGRAREALDLHYRDGLAWDDVARRIGLQPNGLKTLVQRARRLLKECLERNQT
jgi:RNA polymerase sigma-70 factor (ECF subfamily)